MNMSKEAKLLEKSIRDVFVEKGCKRVGYVEYLLSKNGDIFVIFFTRLMGRENRVETHVSLRCSKLNELAFYISEYGTEYKGRILKGPFPGNVNIPKSLHVSGAASFSLYGLSERFVYKGEGISAFASTCIDRGVSMLNQYADVEQTLIDNLNREPPADDAIIINLFLERWEAARALVETCREPDGVFLAAVPNRADRYLCDLGY